MKARCDRPLQRLMSVTMNTYQPKIITETRRKIEDLCRKDYNQHEKIKKIGAITIRTDFFAHCNYIILKNLELKACASNP
jgi:hypothetical protein